MAPHLRGDLANVPSRVVAPADDSMQMRLTPRLVLPDAPLEELLRLLDVEAVQVDTVTLNAAGRVVGAEDELGRLAVVVVHLAVVSLALVGELLGRGAVAVVVRSVGLERGSQYRTLRGWDGARTRSKQSLRRSASLCAMSRRRSYSRSVSSSSPE